jgi:hypothetical protein
MILFDRLNINKDKSQEQNLQALKAWADNLVDSLQILQNQIEDLKKSESEGK